MRIEFSLVRFFLPTSSRVLPCAFWTPACLLLVIKLSGSLGWSCQTVRRGPLTRRPTETNSLRGLCRDRFFDLRFHRFQIETCALLHWRELDRRFGQFRDLLLHELK